MHVMMYKIIHGFTPKYMGINLEWKRSEYYLRAGDNLALPKPRTNYCKRTFFYRGSSLFNELNPIVRNAATLYALKQHLSKL